MLDAAIRLADAVAHAFGPGKKTYISGHEGLKIGLLQLHRLTGDEKYLRTARFFLDERGREDYPRTLPAASGPFSRAVRRGHEMPNLSAWNETCASYGSVRRGEGSLQHRWF